MFQLAFVLATLSIVCAFVNYAYSVEGIHLFKVCFELFHVTVIVKVNFVLLSEHKFICYKQEAWKLGLDQYPN